MKLFIWIDPYKVPYGSSLLFAVAESVEQAKQIAVTAPAFEYGKYEGGRPGDVVTLGDPIRVLDLPCAEWHQWSV